jgi:hypothetical protein
MKSCLQNRFQRVVIDSRVHHNTTTDWGKISRVVPQASILGPLLFFMYINDLPKILINNYIPVTFADGTSVIITNSNPTGFQKDIQMYLNIPIHGSRSVYYH